MIERLFRNIPEFKGKKRLLGILFRQKRKNARDLFVQGKYGCVYKLPNIIENVGFDIFANGIYEKDTIDFVVEKCSGSAYFIDIGANIGSISIPVCKQLDHLKTIAVEASPKVYEYLKWNVHENGLANITHVNRAVSDTDDVFVDFYSPDEKYGKGSMAPVFERNAQSVNSITLDRLIADYKISDIGLIKVDVEGFEYFVFKGGEHTLNKPDAPDILFEFVDWAEKQANAKAGDAQKLLFEYGYALFLIEKTKIVNRLSRPVESGAAMIWATKKL